MREEQRGRGKRSEAKKAKRAESGKRKRGKRVESGKGELIRAEL